MSGQPSPEQVAAISEFFEVFEEVCGSVGRHEGHSLSKAGRCVYCSCGFRYQGTLPTAKERAECAKSYAERGRTEPSPGHSSP